MLTVNYSELWDNLMLLLPLSDEILYILIIIFIARYALKKFRIT